MQPLVSIVIAAYNKEKYIGELLDSVLEQTWRNVQLVIVDDGSTDATAAIIAGYEARFLQAGMGFFFVRQKNAGVAKAVSNGLSKAEGDFVCLPDADDVLLPTYVEEMASIMAGDSSVQWCVCDSNRTRWTQYLQEYTDELCPSSRFRDLLERYILFCNCGMVWQLMIRASYLQKTRIAECLALLGKTVTHEAPVWIPLLCGKGEGVYLPRKLYLFRDVQGSLSNPGSVEKVMGYARQYREAIVASLRFCGVADRKMFFCAMLRECMEILLHAPILKGYVCLWLSDTLLRGNFINKPLEDRQLLDEGGQSCYYFCVWLWRNLIPQFAPPVRQGRVVAYGVLGQRATNFLPAFEASIWKPDMLWDRGGGSVMVQKPDFAHLGKGDTVLCFPKSPDVLEYVRKNVPEGVSIIYGLEMERLYAGLQFRDYPIFNVAGAYGIVD